MPKIPKPSPGPGEFRLEDEPDLIGAIRYDFESLGVRGDMDIAMLLYAAGTSRLLPDPLGVICFGKSSTGKSEIQRRATRMFPDDQVVQATTMTPNALYYG